VIVFRKQESFVCPSVIKNFVSKNTIANHVYGTVICQRRLCFKEQNNCKYIFYKHYVNFVLILMLPVCSYMGVRVHYILALFFSS